MLHKMTEEEKRIEEMELDDSEIKSETEERQDEIIV